MKYHNKVLNKLAQKPPASEPALTPQGFFEQARQLVRWHYQWIVLYDFLPRIVGPEIVEDLLAKEEYRITGADRRTRLACVYKGKRSLKFFNWKQSPFMPVEFSVGAYRFGHSMLRARYALNSETTGSSKILIFDRTKPGNPQANDLTGFRIRPRNRSIQWGRFFDVSLGADYRTLAGEQYEMPQVARAIDTQLVNALGGLPFAIVPDSKTVSGDRKRNLAYRNLVRGMALGLPSGQDVARRMGIPEDLIIGDSAENIPLELCTQYDSKSFRDGAIDKSVPPRSRDKRTTLYLQSRFGASTPLWYYILKEAEVICSGRTLGPVGGRLVAEVFVGLLFGDAFSFLNVAPNWKPDPRFGAEPNATTNQERFNIARMLEFLAD